MKKIIISLFALAAGLSLVGCGKPVYHTLSTFNPPETLSGKQCVSRCLQNKVSCDKRCGSDHQACLINERKAAERRYVQYVNRMVETKHKIKLKEQDFIDYNMCSATCRCVKSFKNCYALCGGVVSERKICVKNCKKGSQ